VQWSRIVAFKSQNRERSREQAWAEPTKPGGKHDAAKKQRYRSAYGVDVQPQRAGNRRGNRLYSDRVSRSHTWAKPPAAIRLHHRVPNLNERPALGKAALPLSDVRKVMSAGATWLRSACLCELFVAEVRPERMLAHGSSLLIQLPYGLLAGATSFYRRIRQIIYPDLPPLTPLAVGK